MMIWWDFVVAGQLMWGVVTGYQGGFRRAVCRLGVLLCAVTIALLGKAELICFGSQYGKMEIILEAMVHSRLAIPVSGSSGEAQLSADLPKVLWKALPVGTATVMGKRSGNFATCLIQLLGCIFAFLAGLALWWWFFHLWGMVFSGKKERRLSMLSRWGGALVGLIRQLCSAALLIGVAVPLAWLCRVPPGLMQLEKTLLARWAWDIFVGLGIWH